MHISLALIAIVLGFKLFLDSTKEKQERYRTTGRVLGLYVVTISILMSFFWFAKFANYCSWKYGNRPLMSALCPVAK
jgi:cytochrome bd-type quinol oxidase subunit 2